MNTPERTAVRPPTAALRLKPWQQFALLGALSMFAPLSTDMYLPALPSVATRPQRVNGLRHGGDADLDQRA